ncbi:alkaline phosphatase family protein [Roseofilum sp. Guam]|uniref:alkaline phosphatase family protein n=1 Tax=Roseofilum sp. Guam TaxID=2821502 RepID=UPI001B0F89F6|nr:alkaline phosphatase family protein [Roseofilum sp. Guam]
MMSKQVIVVLLDGLRFDVAVSSMGYLGHLVETLQASLYQVRAELPSLSRPLYEVLLTGTPVSVNGIGANDVVRLSHQQSVFHLATEAGLTTAAAAYSWFSELYNHAPFVPQRDRDQHNTHNPIQHGRFYWEDSYPDSHLFADAEMLRQAYNPDFFLVHSMGIDHAGHGYGSDSKEYRGYALLADSLLSHYIPLWREAGYTLLITADHGMNPDGHHGGTLPDVREVPLFTIGTDSKGEATEPISQLAIAPLICTLLDISPAPAMLKSAQALSLTAS